MSERVMIVTGVPPDYAEAVLDAISAAGGGIVGDYSHCAFTHTGYGQFKPSDHANPHIGDTGTINRVEEIRIETFCDRTIARQVVHALKAAHPYEEVVVYILPLLNEDDL